MVTSRSCAEKVSWSGRLTAVQPRVRLMRSFDERQHSYLGYVLRLEGAVGEELREFSVAGFRLLRAASTLPSGPAGNLGGIPVLDGIVNGCGFAGMLFELSNAESGLRVID